MNKVILAGRLTADPEVRYTQTGKAVANFRIAVNRRVGSKDAQQGQPTADFFTVIAWQKLGEICGNYLAKGSQVIVEGRLQTRSYDAQDGSKRYVTEIVANDIEFIGSKAAAAAHESSFAEGGYSAQPAREEAKPYDPASSLGHDVPSDEEIPF